MAFIKQMKLEIEARELKQSLAPSYKDMPICISYDEWLIKRNKIIKKLNEILKELKDNKKLLTLRERRYLYNNYNH